MNYWIFIVTTHKIGGKTYSAEEIYVQRMLDGFWGLGEKTPNRKNLQKGDKVIFYFGLPKKSFGGTATLASSSFKLDENYKAKYWHEANVYHSDFGVLLEDINTWEKSKPIEDLLPSLSFIENIEYWYSYFQGGVRQITEEDYRIILSERETSPVGRLNITQDIESQTEFALETHLEEFIYSNWVNIDWGANLLLYKTEEQDGRQFPAGTWSIDFLATDKNTKDLVVIELKRGKTSDATVGQILRYISWVKENVAEKGQNVRGIIIAKDIDDALRYAVKSLDNIEVKTYKVDFRLQSFRK